MNPFKTTGVKRKEMMNTADFDIDILTGKYIRGALSDREEKELARWVNATQDHQTYFKQKIKQWEEQSVPEPSPEWQQLVASKERKRKKTVLFRSWSVAAAIAVIFSASWFLYHQIEKISNSWIVVSVPYGKIDSVVLPDHSRVILNAGSVLKYGSDFNRSNRKVELRGEGFFQVAKQKGEKFTVIAGKTEAIVYGTSFNFHYYGEDQDVAVTLCSGSLKIKNNDHSFFIEPGEQAFYNVAAGQWGKRKVETDLYCNWTSGKLSFHSERLSTIVPKIERKYQVKINLQSQELAGYSFSGEFPGDATLDYVLSVIRESSPVCLKIEKQDKFIHISIDR